MFSHQFTWSWAAEHGYWGWWKFIWMQKTVWRNPQKQNHPRAFKYRGAALGSEAPWTTNNVMQCLKECSSVSSILFPWHQHQSWDDGLTWSFLASVRPGSLEGRGVFGGPDVPCFVPHLSDLEPWSQDTPFDWRSSVCKTRSTFGRQVPVSV